MERRSPRLRPETAHAIKWIIGNLLGLVAISTLFNIKGFDLVPATIGVVVIAFFTVFRSLLLRVPPMAWTIYTILILPVVAIDIVGKETISALLDLNTWLVLYRSLNHRKRREEMQLVLLGLFLIVMVGILTSSLMFGIQLVAYAGLAIAFLVVGNALECKTQGRTESSRELHERALRLPLARVFGPGILRASFLGSLLFGALLGIAALTFVMIPRFNLEKKVTLFRMPTAKTSSGFSEEIKLGEVTDIKKDNRIALRVDAADKERVPLTPYWRMVALDSYDNGSLSLSPELKELFRGALASAHHSRRYWPQKRFSQTPSDGPAERWTFFLEPEVSRFLPVMGSFEQMTLGELNDLQIGPHMHVFAMKEANSKMLSYQLENVEFSGDIADLSSTGYSIFIDSLLADPDREDQTIYPHTLLEIPEDPKIRSYLEQVVSKIRVRENYTPREFAAAISRYLGSRHTYSLSTSLPPAIDIEDPVVRWMQAGLSGHCEYFASAFLLLSRAAGYPTRVAVGFKGGAWNAYENYFMVRNSDAHAWCEVYDGEGSWFRVDPTPGSPAPTAQPLAVAVEDQRGVSDSIAFVDSLRMMWYRRIVNFDQQSQKEAISHVRSFLVAYVEVARDWLVSSWTFIVDWFSAPWNPWRFLYLSSLLALLVGFLWVQRRMALNFRELILATFRRGDPIRRKAGKMLSRLQAAQGKGGAMLLPDSAQAVAELQRLRFGPKATWPNPSVVFRKARRLL